MWWNAATTRASGRSACACSAADPSGGGVNSRGPPKVSGTTVLIATLPRVASRNSGSVAGSPAAGRASTMTSPSSAASRLVWPMIGSRLLSSRSSAAFTRARSGSREPMMIECPTCAQRSASPAPSLPVPPRMAMFMSPRLYGLTKEVARRIADQRLRAFLAWLETQPADDGHRDAVELAHHELGGTRELVGDREDRRGERAARGVGLAEIAPQRRDAA